ncbi:MAG: Gmad2 immunoglobulin-like domain-containing protein [Solirubrobacteraceae bacterium]
MLVSVLALAASACGSGSSGPSSSAPSTTKPPPPVTKVVAYLMRGEHVAPVRRTVSGAGSPALRAVAGLLHPLSTAERGGGLSTQIPAGTKLLGVRVRHGLATVDLSRRFESGGGSLSMQARVAQVVYTLTRVPGVKRVAFRLDGRPVKAIGGEGVIVAPSVDRAAFEQMAPAILVESPLPGTAVASPLQVSGSANVFEATFVVEVTDWDGRIIAHRTVHATSGTGTRGTFVATVRFTAPSGGPARLTLIAFEPSAKDGSPTNEVEIPLRLKR